MNKNTHSSKPLKIALLASGNGTNMQSILDACQNGTINVRPTVVIGNNSKAFAFERARLANIPTAHLSSVTHPESDDLDEAILRTLIKYEVDLVVLAGYVKQLGKKTISQFNDRIINIHPGLLPKYGGQGFYGRRVHEAVLANNETETGVTVHLVDEEYDHGATLGESRVPIFPTDTPETLSKRVLEEEHRFYVEIVRQISEGELLDLRQI